MKNDLTLLVLAAGNSKRYGALKQLDPVGPKNELILDFLVYNAKNVGFTKVIFIVQEKNIELFKNTIEKRIKNYIEVDYVYQKESFGTAHALYCAKDKIKTDFVIINSDDLYNKEEFEKITKTIENSIIGYKLDKTINSLPANRGLLKIENDYLKEITETEINESNINELKDVYVSMNMIKLSKDTFKYIEEYIDQENKKEYQIPSLLNYLIKECKLNIRVHKTDNKIIGLTFKEDKEKIMDIIKEKIKKDEYPNNLWE